ncbi:hypothetical protein SGCOL_010899 [Colletotrichum sp. CLE4]
MSFKSAIVVLATLAVRTLAAPTEPVQPQSPEDWTLLNFRRTCAADQSRCSYAFVVSEDAAKVPKYCNFDIDAAGGLPAYQTDFSNLKCPGVPEYSINGGWDEQGFITLTVINDPRKLLSFFAFRDDELWTGEAASPQQSEVFGYPFSAKREVMASQEESEMAYASSWKIKDFIRYEFNRGAPYSDALIFRFGIQSGPLTEACLLIMPLFEGTVPLGKSFADAPCGYGGWTVSWGHNETTDEAVMTLMNANHDRRAFYGFNDVSKNIILGDNGPRPASAF